ncbi:hypothetical protein CHUAL_010157 [Chamberlinius hualienensis]
MLIVNAHCFLLFIVKLIQMMLHIFRLGQFSVSGMSLCSTLRCNSVLRNCFLRPSVSPLPLTLITSHNSSTFPNSASRMATANVIQTVNNVVKSEIDKRFYRGLELANNMKVLLISDPETDKSAAALDVHVGLMNDPSHIPGLAHLCEHMLFLGTEKYPSVNEYKKFLSEHGGKSNAYTASENTNFFFDVTPDHLRGALDRFAQFFLCPLFSECSTDLEINAVHSEHEKNLQSDSWRLEQLFRNCGDSQHDFSKFGTGNKETLDGIPKAKEISVRDELLKYHSDWYSANIMGLAILGKESLDELQEMVTETFVGAVNKNVSIREWNQHPYGPEQLKKIVYVVPIKDIRKLSLTFPIPYLHPYYKTSPGHYLGHLIGHEGPGSLLSELKARGWANVLVGGQKDGARGFGFFVINCDLTEDGIEHIDDIITLMFEYIWMLKQEKSQQWVFDECKHLGAMTFRFKDKEIPSNYTCNLASNLHDYPIEEVLSGPYLMENYDSELIDMVLSKLNPDNVHLAVVGKKFEGTTDRVEQWYGTEYREGLIPDETLEKWRNVGSNPSLRLPLRNDFIPTNFELVEREEKELSVPELIKENALARVWFKQDNTYLLPKAALYFQITSPLAYADPLHCNFASMFVLLFQDALNEYTYDAQLAGLSYYLSNTKYGICLTVKGYNDKQPILLEKVIDKLTSFRVDQKRFDIIKENYIRGIRNFQSEQPHQHASYYMALLINEHGWTKEELLSSTDELTPEALQAYIPKLLGKLHIETLFHGNITKQRALDMVALVENQLQTKMQTKPLLKSQLVRDREIQLPDNSHYLMKTENLVHPCQCITIYYQCTLQGTKTNVVLELFSQIAQEPCFNTLRTKEQLGYIVWSGIRRSNSVQGFTIIVQSDRNSSYVDGRIEAFLLSMESYLEEMSDDEFERHRESLIALRLEKPKKLFSQTSKYWNEITCQQYNFERDSVEVSVLRNFTKKDVIDFFKELLSCNAPRRHKLAVHVVNPNLRTEENAVESICPDGLSPAPTTVTDPTIIDDVTQFKSVMGLFPLLPPFIPLDKETKSKL